MPDEDPNAPKPATPKQYKSEAIVTLNVPIKTGQREITTVKLRRPKVRDRRQAAREGESDVEREAALLRLISDLSATEFDELDLSDYTQIAAEYESFLAK